MSQRKPGRRRSPQRKMKPPGATNEFQRVQIPNISNFWVPKKLTVWYLELRTSYIMYLDTLGVTSASLWTKHQDVMSNINGAHSFRLTSDSSVRPSPRAPNSLKYLDPPNVALLRALWSLLDGIWGLLKGSWGAGRSCSFVPGAPQ